MLFLEAAMTVMAQSNPIRLAIGPFFAPADNPALVTAANAMPDLLTASLSQDSHFQLVERQQINAIWAEMHLTEAGLTSATTVMQFGKMLSCDLLVSGTFAQTPNGPVIWVKVINPQTSRVLDLQSFPAAETNADATTAAISHFIIQAGDRSTPREFIAVGKFEDQSTAPGKEDWAPKIVAMVEKHFMAMGYGVVERNAVNPIFSEYQFQAEGMTGNDPNRVKLAPAFWMIDGGCKWIHTSEDKISVAIRFQRAGQPEQLFSFSKPPGDEVEKALIETIQTALTNAGSITAIQAQQFEEKVVTTHAEELSRGRGESMPTRYDTNATYITVTAPDGSKRKMEVDPMSRAMQENHANDSLQTLEQAILLNPKDMKDKWYLGMSWFPSPDAGENKRGEDLLEEVVASGDPEYAAKAKNWLSDIRSGKIEIVHDPGGTSHMVFHGQPASFPEAPTGQSQPATQPRAANLAPLVLSGPSKNQGPATTLSQITMHMIAGGDPNGLFDPSFVSITTTNGQVITQRGVPPTTPDGYRQLELDRLQALENLRKKPIDRDLWLLGLGWFMSPSPGDAEKGIALIQQAAGVPSSAYARRARLWLDDFQAGRLTVATGQSGKRVVIAHGEPAILKLCNRTDGVDDIATLVPNLNPLADIEEIGTYTWASPAYRFWHGYTLFGMGKELHIVNSRNPGFGRLRIPVELDEDISAIEVSQDYLWLGCSNAVVEVNRKNNAARKIDATAGFPQGDITALCYLDGKLYMGFSSDHAGAFGYLDLATAKYTAIGGGAIVKGGWWQAMRQPPAAPVLGIFVKDHEHLWVVTSRGFQVFDLSADSWNIAGSALRNHQGCVGNDRLVAINQNFIAIPDNTGEGVLLCRFPGTNWITLSLFDDPSEDSPTCLATDPTNPNYLWIGANGGWITLLDTASRHILVHDQITTLYKPCVICPQTDDIVVGGGDSQEYEVSLFSRSPTIPTFIASPKNSGDQGSGER